MHGLAYTEIEVSVLKNVQQETINACFIQVMWPWVFKKMKLSKYCWGNKEWDTTEGLNNKDNAESV